MTFKYNYIMKKKKEKKTKSSYNQGKKVYTNILIYLYKKQFVRNGPLAVKIVSGLA